MKIHLHKFAIGATVCFAKSIHKKHGIVLAHDHSYGWPTYTVKLEDDTIWTLCEDDLSA